MVTTITKLAPTECDGYPRVRSVSQLFSTILATPTLLNEDGVSSTTHTPYARIRSTVLIMPTTCLLGLSLPVR